MGHNTGQVWPDMLYNDVSFRSPARKAGKWWNTRGRDAIAGIRWLSGGQGPVSLMQADVMEGGGVLIDENSGSLMFYR